MTIECSISENDSASCDGRCVLGLLGERYVPSILDATMEESRTANQIARERGVPQTTLYRRLDGLVAAGFLREELQFDGQGHHYKTYRSAIDGFDVRRTDDGFRIDVSYMDPEPDEGDGITVEPQATTADAD